MFVTADGKVIPVDIPFTLGDLQYPANWLRITSEAKIEACKATGELAPVVTTGGLTEWPKSPSDLV